MLLVPKLCLGTHFGQALLGERCRWNMRSDFAPTAPWPNLLLRAKTLQRLRAFFDTRGFVEVETPLLSHDSVIDLHLDPIPVTLFADPRNIAQGRTLYLQTSPEFGMKRLLAAGQARAIYQITRAFRGAEQGSQHNPEFTMLEWYRVGDDYAAGMQLLADLAQEMFDVDAVERLTYRAAFHRYAGSDPCDPARTQNDFELDVQLVQQVQPNLGTAQPTILHDYPATQAALAQTSVVDGCAIAERFELYYRGMELANGYHELLDPEVLRMRNRETNVARRHDGRYELPEHSRLIDAMQHGLPACSGCALGVDRLVMLLASAATIDEVIAFPIERA